MTYQIGPFSDRWWNELAWRHPNSSIFHTSGWFEALRRAYGYEAVVYTIHLGTGIDQWFGFLPRVGLGHGGASGFPSLPRPL